MKKFKQFLMEDDTTLARQDAAKVIDSHYDRVKQMEINNPEDSRHVTSQRINPTGTYAADDYDYWKNALYQGQEGTDESDKLYDWMWGMMRHKTYPYQDEIRQAKESGSDYEKMLASQLQKFRKDQVKPEPSEAPAGEPAGQYYKSSNASEEEQIRAIMAGHPEQDIQRIIDQRNKDKGN